MTDFIGERFDRETATHTMEIAHDNGLYRHLKFRATEHSWNMWFDLITVPGALIFQGDGDAFVFRRLDDMFAFFRGGFPDHNPERNPNYGYWHEKLVSGHDNAARYEQNLLIEQVNEVVDDALASAQEHYPDEDILKGLKDAIQEDILDELADDESHDRGLVESFRYWIDPDAAHRFPRPNPDFEFHDVWEWRTRGYTWWYRWACHAIVWGIAYYDTGQRPAPRPIAPKDDQPDAGTETEFDGHGRERAVVPGHGYVPIVTVHLPEPEEGQ